MTGSVLCFTLKSHDSPMLQVLLLCLLKSANTLLHEVTQLGYKLRQSHCCLPLPRDAQCRVPERNRCGRYLLLGGGHCSCISLMSQEVWTSLEPGGTLIYAELEMTLGLLHAIVALSLLDASSSFLLCCL